MSTASKQPKKATLSYLERRQRSEQEIQSEESQFQADTAKLQLQSDILATQQSLAEANRALDNAKSCYPFSSKAILEAEIKVEGLEDGLARLDRYKAELFPGD